MNMEKVVFAFFIVLAATLNLGFFLGDMDNPDYHNVYSLFATLIVSIIATVMKFGDRTQIGAVLLASSLVADVQLGIAALVWAMSVHVLEVGLTAPVTTTIVAMAGGALFANTVSVILLVTETVLTRR